MVATVEAVEAVRTRWQETVGWKKVCMTVLFMRRCLAKAKLTLERVVSPPAATDLILHASAPVSVSVLCATYFSDSIQTFSALILSP